MNELNEMSLKELFELQQQLGCSICPVHRYGKAIEERVQAMMKKCVICGKEHNCREYTCSDECHNLFKQILIREFGEYKIVVDLATEKEYRVPIVDIIEKGLKQEDLKKYLMVGEVNEIKSFDDAHSVRLRKDGCIEVIEYMVDEVIKIRELKQQKKKIEVSWINLDTGEVGVKKMTVDEYIKEMI